MEELGIKLKNTREKNGVSKEEAAEDLKITIEQLEAIEAGSNKEFEDVYYFKSILEEYAKYLGLDVDKISEDFSEFLFDFTSKIPIEKIKEESEKKEVVIKEIVSPYTLEIEEKKRPTRALLYIGIIIAIIAMAFLILKIIL